MPTRRMFRMALTADFSPPSFTIVMMISFL